MGENVAGLLRPNLTQCLSVGFDSPPRPPAKRKKKERLPLDIPIIYSIIEKYHTQHGANHMLKFSNANAKIEALKNDAELSEYLTDKRKVYSLDLLSGYSCPFAEACLSKAVVKSDGKRKIQDGHKTQFRCFSASQEDTTCAIYASTILTYSLARMPIQWSNLSTTDYQKTPVLFASTLQAISLIRNISERGA